jgi:hypothetical protein
MSTDDFNARELTEIRDGMNRQFTELRDEITHPSVT